MIRRNVNNSKKVKRCAYFPVSYSQNVIRKGTHKRYGNQVVIVERDHRNGLVTISINGQWKVVRKDNLK